MADILIRGMEMPDCCLRCPFYANGGCKVTMKIFPEWMNVASRPKDCPMKPFTPPGPQIITNLVLLDDRTALAIAAGARAIRENKRLVGSKYVYDVFGKNGGPYEISYREASEILASIWDAYPLPEPSGGDER